MAGKFARPLIMVTQFVGFMAAYRDPGALPPMLAGTLGGLLTTWVTFTPCFLWIFLGAPFVKALRGNKALSGALTAITAAVVGVILNLAVWFALHTWFRETNPVRTLGLSFDAPVLASLNPWALALSAATMIAIFRFKTRQRERSLKDFRAVFAHPGEPVDARDRVSPSVSPRRIEPHLSVDQSSGRKTIKVASEPIPKNPARAATISRSICGRNSDVRAPGLVLIRPR